MTSTSEKPLLIGVDGGASGVRAWAVRSVRSGGRVGLVTVGEAAERSFDEVPDFEPVPLEVQLAERQRATLTPSETRAAHVRVEACAGVVKELAERLRARRILVGVCMPGLKTPDGRGIAVLRNGPRILDLAARWEGALERDGIELAQPIARLLSDGEACARGEVSALHGSLRGVTYGYYVGGGTGVAEAFTMRGAIVGLDTLAGRCPKAWELRDTRGQIFEDRLSMRGLNSRWDASGAPLDPGSNSIEAAGRRGDESALRLLSDVADALAELVVLRAVALADFGGRAPLILERVVIGQRLGRLFADARLEPWLRARAAADFRARMARIDDAALARRYLALAGPPNGRFVASTLRAAPAIGAAWQAWMDALAVPGMSR